MSDAESFLAYRTRAQTLQSIVNYDEAPEKLSVPDFTLAKYVTFGMPGDLLAKVSDFELLEATPFCYSQFEQRACLFYQGLPKRLPARSRPTIAAGPSTSAPLNRTRKENVWRVHAYLDSQGRCHYCKKTCVSAPGACAGPIDIPPMFVAPPKPVDYKPPRPSA